MLIQQCRVGVTLRTALPGGPTWAEHRTGYHFYAAIGANF
jgi:hypothetical protein